tara:strand:- start:422 stop:577 length:156 start_codon:yes stop_codon:yes gene_type:complete
MFYLEKPEDILKYQMGDLIFKGTALECENKKLKEENIKLNAKLEELDKVQG